MVYKCDDKILVFSMQGNCIDKSGNYCSVEVLYESWKNYIGQEIEWKSHKPRIISKVDMQGDFIFIETIRK